MSKYELSRRDYLVGVGVTGVAGILAGCITDTPGEEELKDENRLPVPPGDENGDARGDRDEGPGDDHEPDVVIESHVTNVSITSVTPGANGVTVTIENTGDEDIDLERFDLDVAVTTFDEVTRTTRYRDDTWIPRGESVSVTVGTRVNASEARRVLTRLVCGRNAIRDEHAYCSA